VAVYDGLAPYYDLILGDRTWSVARVLDQIGRFRPGARSLLELGCGTGSVLVGLASVGERAGLDCSAEMLALARAKLPGVRLLEGDMADFDLGERFEVVICVLDTLNHLDDFPRWSQVFARVRDHLVDGGLFLFDVIPPGPFRAVAAETPWTREFGGRTVTVDVTCSPEGRSVWDIAVEVPDGSGRIQQHSTVVELGVALDRVAAALAPYFEVLEQVDPDGDLPDDDSDRVYFACRPRPGEPA
jgi:SAM-dependent methyltransferase